MKTRYFPFLLLVCIGCTNNEEGIITLPVPPTDLSASLFSATQVDLSWRDNSTNEEGFKIDRKEGTGQWNTIASVSADITSYSDQGLTIGTTYTYRTFAFNKGGNSPTYSNEVSVITKSAPLLSTTSISNIGILSASSGGKITNDGGSPVTSKGVCWSTDANPTISLTTKTVNGSGIDTFTSVLTGLSPNTKYYVRSYAVNSSGVGYGDELSFTTTAASPPILTTTDLMAISYRTASSGGQITSNGGASIIGKGLVWSISPNPTFDDNSGWTSEGTGTGSFVSDITNLQPATKYYVRAYARNASAIGYGPEKVFTTIELTVPSVVTLYVDNITSKSARSGGSIITDGGTEISAKGVCWSTSPNPTTSDFKTADGTGIANFTSNISGLTLHTKYYVRAYATNTTGTGYGTEMSFTTSYAMGEIGPAGGFIFYDKGVVSSGWRYLEAAPSDLSYPSGIFAWWIGTWIYQDLPGISPDKELGFGKANTPLIVAANGNLSNAAKACDDYSFNGFTDWYLPSIDELELICLNLFSEGIGSFNYSDATYWSSTDTNAIHSAWYMQFSNTPASASPCSIRTDSGRDWQRRVRPVRQF